MHCERKFCICVVQVRVARKIEVKTPIVYVARRIVQKDIVSKILSLII